MVRSKFFNASRTLTEIHVLAFTKDQFDNIIKQGLVITKNLAFASLAFTALKALYTHFVEGRTVWSTITSAFSVLLFSAIAVLLFMASTVSR